MAKIIKDFIVLNDKRKFLDRVFLGLFSKTCPCCSKGKTRECKTDEIIATDRKRKTPFVVKGFEYSFCLVCNAEVVFAEQAKRNDKRRFKKQKWPE